MNEEERTELRKDYMKHKMHLAHCMRLNLLERISLRARLRKHGVAG